MFCCVLQEHILHLSFWLYYLQMVLCNSFCRTFMNVGSTKNLVSSRNNFLICTKLLMVPKLRADRILQLNLSLEYHLECTNSVVWNKAFNYFCSWIFSRELKAFKNGISSLHLSKSWFTPNQPNLRELHKSCKFLSNLPKLVPAKIIGKLATHYSFLQNDYTNIFF